MWLLANWRGTQSCISLLLSSPFQEVITVLNYWPETEALIVSAISWVLPEWQRNTQFDLTDLCIWNKSSVEQGSMSNFALWFQCVLGPETLDWFKDNTSVFSLFVGGLCLFHAPTVKNQITCAFEKWEHVKGKLSSSCLHLSNHTTTMPTGLTTGDTTRDLLRTKIVLLEYL